MEDGSWSQEIPECKGNFDIKFLFIYKTNKTQKKKKSSTEITCDDPETADSLLVDSGTKAVGVLAKFSCPKGRFIVGNDTRTCLKSGKWSGKNPICKCKSSCLVLIQLLISNLN